MTETSQLKLPLLQPSQAQKHVTVNEALVRLDALAQLVLESRVIAAPPLGVAEGQCYAVPAGAQGGWAGQDGNLAIFANGGWVFTLPRRGWRAWVADEAVEAVFDGLAWQGGAWAVSPHRAGAFFRVLEFDHVVTAGAVSLTTVQVPEAAMVFAVTGRVLEAITGSLGSWKLGSPDGEDRFGSGLGRETGSWVRGLLSQPMTYWAAAPLRLAATGGVFAGGKVRLAIHYLQVTPPAA